MAKKLKPVMILGSRIFAEELHDLIVDCPDYQCSGFVENMDRQRCESLVMGKPVIWVDALKNVPASTLLVCGIGSNKRAEYVDYVKHFGLTFARILHPSCHFAASSQVGEGTVLGVNSIVAAQSVVGRHVIVNRAATIGHHTKIGDFTTIAPQANIAGMCRIGTGCYIAMGATVLDGIQIGDGAVVGAGALVTKDVAANTLVAGSPARVAKTGVNGR